MFISKFVEWKNKLRYKEKGFCKSLVEVEAEPFKLKSGAVFMVQQSFKIKFKNISLLFNIILIVFLL